jgi:8-oxo-dGTP pyrophosphatase MutT (NUDIX family)
MANNGFWRGVAQALRKAPWVVTVAMAFWRLRQAKFSAGVAGIIFNPAGQVLLVEHVFHPHAPWGLPGGWVDRREDPAGALEREMREELGMAVRVGPVLLAEVEYDAHIDLAYICYSSEPVGTLSSELLDYGWFDTVALPPLHTFHYRAIMRALEILEKVE